MKVIKSDKQDYKEQEMCFICNLPRLDCICPSGYTSRPEDKAKVLFLKAYISQVKQGKIQLLRQ